MNSSDTITDTIVDLVFLVWFGVSLYLPGLIMQDGSTWTGLHILIQEGIFLGTGVPYGYAWWGSPLGFLALIASRLHSARTSIVIAVIAVAASLGSFGAISAELPLDGAETAHKTVAALGSGFYVWEALLIAIVLWCVFRYLSSRSLVA